MRFALALVSTALLCSLAAYAQEAPSRGIIYNTKEDSSITFSCAKKSNGSLACDFVQVAVRRETKPEDVERNVAKALPEYRKASAKEVDDLCRMQDEFAQVLSGKKKAPDPAGFAAMTEIERRDANTHVRLLGNYCADRSEANLLAMLRWNEAKGARTCHVSTNSFSQTFRFVRDFGGGRGAWVVEGKPEGPCGAVQLSRMEQDPKEKTGLFWRYVARKAITNPNGIMFPGKPPIMCKEMDEGEYLYDWRARDRGLGCDYIKFTVL